MEYKDLAEKAVEAKKRSIPKYSNFHVGAALLTDNAKVYLGGNIESASYSLTICAERTALFKALSEGERNFKAISIVSDAEDFTPPCGACRQVLQDFCGSELDVVLMNQNNDLKVFKLKDLLPFSFDEEQLK